MRLRNQHCVPRIGPLFLLEMKLNFVLLAILCWLTPWLATAGGPPARIFKVLPHFLDTNGLHTLSPSLYERDAYQAHLREHPEKRSGIRFDVQWKNRAPVFGKLILRVELRGILEGKLPRSRVLEQEVEPSGFWGRWTSFKLSGTDYRDFGEVTAWRATLLEDNQLIAEQKSFLWSTE